MAGRDTHRLGRGGVGFGFGQQGRARARRSWHLQIEASPHAFAGRVRAAPVTHHQAIKAPLLAEDVGEEPLVLATVHPIEPVVGAHGGPGSTFLHRVFKGPQVEFAKRPFRDDAVDRPALVLGLVAGVMLDGRGDSHLLEALDIGGGEAPGQVGVFGVAFEVAAVEGTAKEVHGGTEQHARAFVLRFAR